VDWVSYVDRIAGAVSNAAQRLSTCGEGITSTGIAVERVSIGRFRTRLRNAYDSTFRSRADRRQKGLMAGMGLQGNRITRIDVK